MSNPLQDLQRAVQPNGPYINPNTGTASSETIGRVMRDGETTTFQVSVDVPEEPGQVIESQFAPPRAAMSSGASTPVATEVNAQFGRMKGAKWFAEAKRRSVIVIGQGGIGSWLTLFLSRLGAPIHTFDMDRFEKHNMSGQLVRNTDVGKLKTTVVREICGLLNDYSSIVTNEGYDNNSYSNFVVMCALDNMATRKMAFEKWKQDLATMIELSEKNPSGIDITEQYFFQDGRLLAEQLQIFNIPGNRPDLIEKYEKEQLFNDTEVEEVDCTFKQTSHCAAMIASHMVGFYTNWISNYLTKDPTNSKLPYYYEYVIPFNMTMQDYANT